MKPLLFLAAAAAVALAGPASTQNAVSPSPPADNGTPPNIMAGGDQGFRIDDTRRNLSQCFSGRSIVGVTRAGERTVYVQPKAGGIFRVELADSCEALNTAAKLTMRSEGDLVCSGQKAVVVVKNTDGAKRCRTSDVRQLTKTEVASLAAAERR